MFHSSKEVQLYITTLFLKFMEGFMNFKNSSANPYDAQNAE